MQTLIKNLRNELVEFVEQRQNLILVLKGDQAGVALTSNMLRELEQEPGTDLFLIVSGAMGDARSVADALAAQIQAEVETTNQLMLESGEVPFPEFPEHLVDEQILPEVRIRESIEYIQGLVDPAGGHRVVIAFFPSSITAPKAFQDVIASLAPGKRYQSWMRGVRLLFCDHSLVPSDHLEELNATRVVTYDLTHEGIQSALYQDLENETLPDEQRVNAAYQLAIFDRAYGRHDEATEKLDYLLGYYQHHENLVMQAFVMQSHGDVCRQQKEYVAARGWYECGTKAAMEADSCQATQRLLQSLTELEQEVGNRSRALQLQQEVHRLADRNGNVDEVIQTEWEQARTLFALGQRSDAEHVLQSTEQRCRELDLEHHLATTQSLRKAMGGAA